MLSLGAGGYYFYDARQMQQMFQGLEKDQIYDLNHIGLVEDLPGKKPVFLGGVVNGTEGQVLYRERVAMQDRDDDIMWKSQAGLDLELGNKEKQVVRVVCTQG